MPRHDDLLDQGPREAPEPETAEQRSQKLGLKTAGGAVVGGGAVAAKAGAIGGLGKLFVWLFAWNAFRSAWFYGGWIAVAVIVAIGLTWYVLRRREVV
ncbi:MAG TPA: hypothetical protein VGK79_10640 [Gaiellaceae bacterium]|jgi:hypothetical protein